MRTTLILGGGFGGLAVADELRRARSKDHRIVVVDQSADFYVGAAKPWVMLGQKQPRQLLHPRAALAKRGVEFVHAAIEAIDPAARSVRTSKGAFEGDDLVVALGANLNMGAVPGLADAAEHFYSIEGAAKLHERLKGFRGGEVVLLIPRTPYKCPAGPYEAALLLADYFERRGLPGTRLTVVTVEGAPMATGGPEIGAFVRRQLAASGIPYLTQKKITGVDGAARTIAVERGEPIHYDLLIAVPPHEAPKVVRDAGLGGPSGWIPVDPKTCAVANRPGVYAVGDVTAVPLPGRFKPDVPLMLPKAGVIAEGMGRAVARNILHQMGLGPAAEFDGVGFCYLETGDMHAMRGTGYFYEMPHPTMKPGVPDMAQYEQKKTWVADTVRRLLG